MTRKVYPLFIYGFTITAENQIIDFSEGGGALQAAVEVGAYTATDFALAVKAALDAAGANTYTVTYNRTTLKMTIAGSGAFSLLSATGAYSGSGIWGLLGFTTATDKTGAATYTGTLDAGYVYRPQFWLQEYVSSDDYQQASDASVNKTATGRTEVIHYGIEKFIEMNITMITDIAQGTGSVVRTNATGVADARRFLQFATTKAPFEYVEDEDVPATFQTVILESTAENSKGTGYRLRELYDRFAPGYFESGKLKLRVIE